MDYKDRGKSRYSSLILRRILKSFLKSWRQLSVFSEADRIWGPLCVLVVLVCILIAQPFAESAFVDDWAYAHVALGLAKSGRVPRNHWVTSTLLFQSYWGALFIRIFGFSFVLLRVITMPFALASVGLAYASGRRLGLAAATAAFGAICFGTSPLFLPFAASFMTEPYSCFFTLGCFYCFLRVIQAASEAGALRWVSIFGVFAILGCLNRQNMAVAPAVLIPLSLWIRRRDRFYRYAAVAVGAVCAVEVLLLAHFFPTPYAPLQLTRTELMHVAQRESSTIFREGIGLFLSWVFLCLPALSCFWFRLRSPFRFVAAGLLSMVGFLALLFWVGGYGTAPFLGGVLPDICIDVPGWKVTIFSPPVIILATVITLITVGIFGREFPRMVWSAGDDSYLLAFFLYAGVYVALLAPGAIVLFLYDRYLVPLLPLTILAVLCRFAKQRPRVPWYGWGCAAVYCLYGVTMTHDYANTIRARVSAARQLESLGVPRQQIGAGMDYDGWTQLTAAGDIRGTSYGDHYAEDWRRGFWLEFWDHTPALNPEYVEVGSKPSDLARKGLPRVLYQTWLPPGEHAIVIWKRPDLTAVLRGMSIVGHLP